jgi:hypothetical protein
MDEALHAFSHDAVDGDRPSAMKGAVPGLDEKLSRSLPPLQMDESQPQR